MLKNKKNGAYQLSKALGPNGILELVDSRNHDWMVHVINQHELVDVSNCKGCDYCLVLIMLVVGVAGNSVIRDRSMYFGYQCSWQCGRSWRHLSLHTVVGARGTKHKQTNKQKDVGRTLYYPRCPKGLDKAMRCLTWSQPNLVRMSTGCPRTCHMTLTYLWPRNRGQERSKFQTTSNDLNNSVNVWGMDRRAKVSTVTPSSDLPVRG